MTTPPNIGWLEVCLNVADIDKSISFYETLGFEQAGGDKEQGWMILERNNARLALYQGHITTNLLNFRGGDVAAIAGHLKSSGYEMESDVVAEQDGTDGAMIKDPDGNLLYFNTHPDERLDGEEDAEGDDDHHGH